MGNVRRDSYGNLLKPGSQLNVVQPKSFGLRMRGSKLGDRGNCRGIYTILGSVEVGCTEL